MMRTVTSTRQKTLLLMMLLCLCTVGCHHKGRKIDDIEGLAAAVALAAQDEPVGDVLFWSFSERQEPLTGWVRGTTTGFRLLATREGVVLPVGGTLVALVESEETVELNDCLGRFSDDRRKLIPGVARPLRLLNLLSGETRDLYTPELPEEQGIEDFEARAFPVASLGATIILKIQEDIVRCSTEQSSRRVEVRAFDVGSGQPVELFSAAERQALLETDMFAAFELLRSNRALRAKGPADLFLRDVELRLSGRRGLTLSYVFTQGDEELSAEGVRHSSALSASVPARTVPASLAAGLPIPAPLARLLETVPDLQVMGWASVSASAQDLPKLLAAFVGDDATANADMGDSGFSN